MDFLFSTVEETVSEAIKDSKYITITEILGSGLDLANLSTI